MKLHRCLLPDIEGCTRQCSYKQAKDYPGVHTWKNSSMVTALKRHIRSSVIAVSAAVVSLIALPAAAQVPPPLQVVKEVAPSSLHPGETGKYTITVSYNGAGTAEGVMLTDTVPAGLIVTGTTPPTPITDPLSWDLGDIASGNNKVVEVDFVVTTAAVPKGEVKATLLNAATATSTNSPPLEGMSEAVELDVSYATGPFIMCPEDVVIDDSCPTSFPPGTYGYATAVDPCDPEPVVTYKDSEMVGDGPGCKEFTRTWTATNKSGCFSTCVQKFKVEYAPAPVITQYPTGSNLGCNPMTLPTCEELKAQVVASGDACGGAVLVECTSATTGDDCNKKLTFTFVATNACGIESQPVTVEYTYRIDKTPPTFTCPEGIVFGCNPEPSELPTVDSVKALVLQTATDNCGDPVTAEVTQGPDVKVGCVVTRVYTVVVSDNCGNDCTECLITYMWLEDNDAPVLTGCPSTPIDLKCNPAELPDCDDAKAQITATDACLGPVEVECDGFVDTTDGCVVTRTFTVTATDRCENVARCNVVYTWKNDDVAPVFSGCPVDPIVLPCNSTPPTCDAAAIAAITATDNCDDVVEVICGTPVPGGTDCNPTLTFKLSAKDSCNNTAECEVVYTWKQDTVAPVFNGCPTVPIVLPCNSTPPTCDAAAIQAITATDACEGEVDVTCGEPVRGGTDCNPTLTFKLTAKDSCNNTAECEVVYTWKQDTVAPVFSGCPSVPIVLPCNSTPPTCDAAEIKAITATDACDGEVIVSCGTPVAGGTDCNPTLTFTLTAVDSCNNRSECDVVYTWKQDTVAPVFAGCPTAPIVLPCNSTPPTCDAAQIKAVTATDACDGPVAVQCGVPVAGGTACNPTLTFTLTATDSCNNTRECPVVFTWKNDSTPPVLSGVPDDIEVPCGQQVPPAATVTALDACDGQVAVTPGSSSTTADCTGYYEITRTWTAVDSCGNTASDSQLIKVLGCPAAISGFVYEDDSNDGIKDVGEAPIAGVKLTLTGTDCEGNAVMLMTTTDASGAYSFPNLPPSNAAGYTVTETHPAGYLDGLDAKNNVPIAGSNTSDAITAIVVNPGDSSENNNFGELVSCGLEVIKTCNPCEVDELLPADCTTLGKPFTITFIYTGGGCAASDNDQMSDTCSGTIDPNEPVFITTPDNPHYIITPNPVNPGEMFTLSAPGTPSGKVDPNSRFVLTNAGGSEDIRFHTSCSEPMGVDDVFGSLTIYAMNGYTGKTTIEYTYKVINHGGAVTGVNIVDDKLGHIAGPFDLAAGAMSAVYTKDALISETTTNKATASGTLVNGTVCEDETEITVTVNRKQCCLLVMDSDALDSGLNSVQQAAAALSVEPAFLVNEDQATETDNPPLRWNELKPGDIVTIPAGVVGDEGLFTLPSNTSFSREAFEAGTVPQSELSTVTGLMPLRNQDLYKLKGMRFVAVVYDKDIKVDYKPVSGCLQGERTGTFTFRVLNVLVPGNLPESSSSNSLYELVVQVEEPGQSVQTHTAKVQDKEPDKVQITKASYNVSNGTLSVFATSSLGSQSLMTVSVDGYIMEAPMKYKSTTKRYEFVMPYPADLRGMKVMISTNKGGSHNTLIK